MPSPEIYPNEITLEYLYETMALIDEKVNVKVRQHSYPYKTRILFCHEQNVIGMHALEAPTILFRALQFL